MARVMVKVVPDAALDADGTWMNRRVPAWVLEPHIDPGRVADRATRIAVCYGGGRFALLTRHCAPEGHHVVAYRRTRGKRVVRRTAAEAMRQLGHEMRRASVSVLEAVRALGLHRALDARRMEPPPVHGQDGGPMHAGWLGGVR